MLEEREVEFSIILTEEERQTRLLSIQRQIIEKLEAIKHRKTPGDSNALKFTCERYLRVLSQCHPEYCIFAEKVFHGVPEYIVGYIIIVLHDKADPSIPLPNREEKRDSLCRLLYGCFYYENVFAKIHLFIFERNPMPSHVFENEHKISEHKLSQRTEIQSYKRAIDISTNQLFKDFPYISAISSFSFNEKKFYILFAFVKQSKNKKYVIYDSFCTIDGTIEHPPEYEQYEEHEIHEELEQYEQYQEEENLITVVDNEIAYSSYDYYCSYCIDQGEETSVSQEQSSVFADFNDQVDYNESSFSGFNQFDVDFEEQNIIGENESFHDGPRVEVIESFQESGWI